MIVSMQPLIWEIPLATSILRILKISSLAIISIIITTQFQPIHFWDFTLDLYALYFTLLKKLVQAFFRHM